MFFSSTYKPWLIKILYYKIHFDCSYTTGALLNDDNNTMSSPDANHNAHHSYSFDLESSSIRKNFPTKLFDVVSDEANSEILQWLPGGKAFIIYDKKRFAASILPRNFKQSQFTSFTRKLSRWSFVRVNRGPLMGAYFHKLFQRDKPALCLMMSCKGNNDEPLDLYASRKGTEAYIPNETPISVPNLGGQDARSAEDMLSIIMLKHSAQEASIAQQALDERQARINRLLHMQRCKQACQALGIPVDSNLPLTGLVQTESNTIKSTNNAACINAYDIDAQMRARTVDRARLLAHTRMKKRARTHLEGLSKHVAQSTQLQPTLLQLTHLQSTRLQSSPLQIAAEQIAAERMLSRNEIIGNCFRTSAI